MKEINIGTIISKKRKEKKITQEDLAEFVGVSKASVSKWETGLSYPDVTFLPELAAFFNITIDELMNYSPQLTKADIRKLYAQLSEDFSKEEFGVVYEKCKKITKKYYACFPLLLYIAILLVNHCNLATSPEMLTEILDEISELCHRIMSESDETNVAKQAENILTVSLMMQGKYVEVVDLIGEDVNEMDFDSSRTLVLSNAYIALGKNEKAKEVLQMSVYGNINTMISELEMMFGMPDVKEEIALEYIKRAYGIAELFNLRKLNFNTMLILNLSAAGYFAEHGMTEKAMEKLTDYVDICCSLKWPIRIKGDEYFDSLDKKMKETDLSGDAPRSQRFIKESMLQGVAESPSFAVLSENEDFKNLIKRLEMNMEEE